MHRPLSVSIYRSHYDSSCANTRLFVCPLSFAPLQHGATPLHCAASYGHTETVRVLIAHPEVDINAVNEVRGVDCALMWLLFLCGCQCERDLRITS